MSLKQEIESWVEALHYYDIQEYDKALEVFEQNADTSKIYFNMGMIYATLGEHELAVKSYERAVELDSFLAVAYFQMGVSNFLLGEFSEAMGNFNEALFYLRGNTLIDYEQLGLKFKLYSCEILFNRGLCYIYDQQLALGMTDLEYAAKEKQVEDHKVIDEAIREQAEGYTVFSVSVGVLYRPNESKVRNVKTKDYLGKARLVAASNVQNAFTGFTGAEVKKMEMTATNATDDRAPNEISFAASNLVKPDLPSRRRPEPEALPKDTSSNLRAERQGFPPTPPPENDFSPKPMRTNTNASMGNASISGRAGSTREREIPPQGGRAGSIREREILSQGGRAASIREESNVGRDRSRDRMREREQPQGRAASIRETEAQDRSMREREQPQGRAASIRETEAQDRSMREREQLQGRAASIRETEAQVGRDRSRDRMQADGYGRRPPVHASPVVPEPRRQYANRGVGPQVGRTGSIRDQSQHRDPVRDQSRHRDPVRDQSRHRDPVRRPAPAWSECSDDIQHNDDVYDMYGTESVPPPSRRHGPGSVRHGASRRTPTSRYEGEDDYASDAYEGSSFDEDDFEMLDARSMRNAAPRARPDVKKIKVKAYGEETRMIMISTSIEYAEFVQRIKEKFQFTRGVRCQIRDEDDENGMITLSDQEDLEIAIAASKTAARRERAEIGKLEIWVAEART